MAKQVTIKITMSQKQAMATAQFYKRMGADDYRLKANFYNQGEFEEMMNAGDIIREELAKAGFSPR